jgi:hypothetical protein
MLYVFYLSVAFGGLSLLPPGAIGNVPASTICAAALIGKTFAGPKRFNQFLALALDGRKLGILTIFCAYMVATAFIFPRLLAGHVELYPLNGADNIKFLQPTSSNITQPLYLLVAFGMTFVFAYKGRDARFRQQFLNASLFGASVLLATGVIDTIMGSIGREDLLAPFHTATYHLLDSVSVAGQHRVVGFMPEASVFSGACCGQLALLYFNRIFYHGIWRRWVVPFVCLGLVYMVYASTSSGGYVALGVLFTIIAGRFLLRLMFASNLTPAHLRQVFWAAIGIAVACGVFLVLPHSIYLRIQLLLDDVLFDKAYSASFIERSAWTHAGIAAFFATHGIGVGVGSIRTSNWFVNFAASTGVVGLVLFGIFVVWMLLPSRNYENAEMRRFADGLKLSLLPGLAIGMLAGTTPDPGVELMLVLGLVYALKQKPAQAVSKNQLLSSTFKSRLNVEPISPLDSPG